MIYRIVTDDYLGFEVQVRYSFWPFWHQLDWCNTHCSIEKAREYIAKDKRKRNYQVIEVVR